VNGAVAQLALDLLARHPVEAAQLGVQQLWNLVQGNPLLSDVNSAMVALINSILTSFPDCRDVLMSDYQNFMLAVWPPGTCSGPSYAVMDSSRRGNGTNSTPGAPQTPVLSIEMFFQSVDSNGQMPWVAFIENVLAIIAAAMNTFLAGYIALRFSGPTRASIGMQRFNQNCSIEISTVGGIHLIGELALLTSILDSMYTFNGVPHWGQLIDLNVQGSGSMYPGYQEWRSVYAILSNNFTRQTFESPLSIRWKLTTP
jgi:hypothetical protein